MANLKQSRPSKRHLATSSPTHPTLLSDADADFARRYRFRVLLSTIAAKRGIAGTAKFAHGHPSMEGVPAPPSTKATMDPQERGASSPLQTRFAFEPHSGDVRKPGDARPIQMQFAFGPSIEDRKSTTQRPRAASVANCARTARTGGGRTPPTGGRLSMHGAAHPARLAPAHTSPDRTPARGDAAHLRSLLKAARRKMMVTEMWGDARWIVFARWCAGGGSTLRFEFVSSYVHLSTPHLRRLHGGRS